MTLEKQVKEFYFARGIDTKPAGEATPLGTLHLLQNARMDRAGEIQKKYGSTAMTLSVAQDGNFTTPATLPTLKKLLSLKDTLLAVGTNTFTQAAKLGSPDQLFRYGFSMDKWQNSGRVGGAIVKASYVADSGSSGTTSPSVGSDMATSGQYLCVVKSIDGSTIATIVDTVTGESFPAQEISGGLYGRVVTFNSKFVVFVHISGAAQIWAYTIDPTTLVVTTTVIATNVNRPSNYQVFFDAVQNGTWIYLTYRDNGGTTTIKRIDSTMAVITTQTVATIPDTHLSIYASGTNVVLCISKTTGLFLVSYTSTLTLITNYNAYATGQVECAYGSSNMIGSTNLVIFSIGAVNGAYFINCGYFDPAVAAFTTIALMDGNYRISSRPFAYQSRDHFCFNYDGASEQDTFFVCHVEPSTSTQKNRIYPVGRLYYGETQNIGIFAAGTIAPQRHPSVVAYNASTTRFATTLSKIEDQRTATEFSYSQKIASIDFADPALYYSKDIAGALVLLGGAPLMYDGNGVVEHGFFTTLETPLFVITPAAGGAMTSSVTYSYIYCYRWTDSKGRTHRSAASAPVSVAMGGADTQTSLVGYDFLFTLKLNYVVEVYRTEGNGTTYYYAGTAAGTAGVINFTDQLSDATLISQALLYTTGGVLDNDALSAPIGMTIFKNRAFVLTTQGLYYSKTISENAPLEFSEAFVIDIETGGGDPIGLGVVLDKLLIFKKDRVYAVAGDGPDSTGGGQLFSAPQVLIETVGAMSQTGILGLGDSTMFQGRGEFWSVLPSLQVVASGTEIEYFLSESSVVNESTILARDDEYTFQLSDKMLLYNAMTKQWSVNPTYGGASNIVANSTFFYLNSSGAPYKQDKTTWKDGSSFVELRATTGWINLDQLLGYQRVWNAYLLARFYTNHTLKVNVYIDYLPKIVDTFTFTASSSTLAAFADSNLFTATPYAGSGTSYRLRMHLRNQKCSAIRFEIYDMDQTGNGQSLDLVGIQLELGVKKLGLKVPAVQQI